LVGEDFLNAILTDQLNQAGRDRRFLQGVDGLG
jgi:hypothetical protein